MLWFFLYRLCVLGDRAWRGSGPVFCPGPPLEKTLQNHSHPLLHSCARERAQYCTFLWFSMIISTTIFWNLMFIMAATVSSCDLISVGPKIIPRLDTVIWFWSLWEDTLHTGTHETQWASVHGGKASQPQSQPPSRPKTLILALFIYF